MGWWSDEVMGGDVPMDLKAGLLDWAGISTRELSECDYNLDIFKDRLTDHLDKMVKYARLASDRTGGISMQVLGAIVLEADLPISVGLCEEICLAADMDDWAAQDLGRREVMDVFKRDIRRHASK